MVILVAQSFCESVNCFLATSHHVRRYIGASNAAGFCANAIAAVAAVLSLLATCYSVEKTIT